MSVSFYSTKRLEGLDLPVQEMATHRSILAMKYHEPTVVLHGQLWRVTVHKVTRGGIQGLNHLFPAPLLVKAPPAWHCHQPAEGM